MADSRNSVQAKATSLYGSGTSIADTTVKLTAFTDIYGNALAMADFGALGHGTIEPGTDNEEAITFSGVTVPGDGTATLTGVKTVLAKTPFTQTAGLIRGHSGGTRFVISNTAAYMNEFLNKSDDGTVTDVITFPDNDTNRARISSDTDTAVATALVTLGQLSRQAISGASNGSTTVKGIFEEATQAELAAGTAAGSTGARLAANPVALAAQIQSGTWLYAVEDGTGGDDTYTAACVPALTAYTAGQIFVIKLTVANTGAATLNLNALGAKNIKKYVSGAQVDPETGDIVANMPCLFEYDGTSMILMNPTAAIPSTALLTEMATFFGATDITGAEAETLTSAVTSNADTLHTHNLYDVALQSVKNNVKVFLGGMNDGMTFDAGAGGGGARTVFQTFIDAAVGGGGDGSLISPVLFTTLNWDNLPALKWFASVELSNTTNDVSFGLFNTAITSAFPNAVSTTRHVAFLTNGATLYASVGDNTTQNRSDVSSGITLTDFNLYEIEMTGTSAIFKINGTVVATLSTNYPTTSGTGIFMSFCTEAQDTDMRIKHPFGVKLTNLLTT
jgi:hypothetical protein